MNIIVNMSEETRQKYLAFRRQAMKAITEMDKYLINEFVPFENELADKARNDEELSKTVEDKCSQRLIDLCFREFEDEDPYTEFDLTLKRIDPEYHENVMSHIRAEEDKHDNVCEVGNEIVFICKNNDSERYRRYAEMFLYLRDSNFEEKLDLKYFYYIQQRSMLLLKIMFLEDSDLFEELYAIERTEENMGKFIYTINKLFRRKEY